MAVVALAQGLRPAGRAVRVSYGDEQELNEIIAELVPLIDRWDSTRVGAALMLAVAPGYRERVIDEAVRVANDATPPGRSRIWTRLRR